MTEKNLIIDLPELRLPRDMAWRVKFIEAVEQHARRLGLAGRFEVPRFFGYYFTDSHAVVIAGLWTVLVDDSALLRKLRETVDKLTDRNFEIGAPDEKEPPFMLVNDSRDGSCWIWEFDHARRFLEGSAPLAQRTHAEDLLDLDDEADRGPRFLGP
ncbi:MAG: hypothetical protein ABW223_06110 [Rariglobus sp.]